MTYMFQRLSRQEVVSGTHGLHKYPAKFIPQLPRWALGYNRRRPTEVVVDPFCGSGTALVEAATRGDSAVGFDISPLATLISEAKLCTVFPPETDAAVWILRLLARAEELVPEILDRLKTDSESDGLHHTWRFWFPDWHMARLLAIKHALDDTYESSSFLVFLKACLSSVAKRSSYLNEDQIKVRYEARKELADPFTTFAQLAVTAVNRQKLVAKEILSSGGSGAVSCCSAVDLPLQPHSVDRIITSPPYINAVDYTMAHKYNLFLLGLVSPDTFKDHCRDYIGVTERAVRSIDLQRIERIGVPSIDGVVDSLRALETPTGSNRAFVVAQFFDGMRKALGEWVRILRPNGQAVVVIGESNRICGIQVGLAELFSDLAESQGLSPRVRFYHQLANRSSMRLNRSATGGTVKREVVLVLTRA
jgi:SAM-dependent methyltransferase